jgi:hypothetical protein
LDSRLRGTTNRLSDFNVETLDGRIFLSVKQDSLHFHLEHYLAWGFESKLALAGPGDSAS